MSKGWGVGESDSWGPKDVPKRGNGEGIELPDLDQVDANLWIPVDLFDRESTTNLTDQNPSTLFYLGMVAESPIVEKVYLEKLDSGRTKIWTVVSERDYDELDKIYEIEETTLERFSNASLTFRVTVQTSGTPTVSEDAEIIYEA